MPSKRPRFATATSQPLRQQLEEKKQSDNDCMVSKEAFAAKLQMEKTRDAKIAMETEQRRLAVEKSVQD